FRACMRFRAGWSTPATTRLRVGCRPTRRGRRTARAIRRATRSPTGSRSGESSQPGDARPHGVGAVREVFEEVGILLAAGDAGPLAGCLAAELLTLRDRLHAGEPFGARRGGHG